MLEAGNTNERQVPQNDADEQFTENSRLPHAGRKITTELGGQENDHKRNGHRCDRISMRSSFRC